MKYKAGERVKLKKKTTAYTSEEMRSLLGKEVTIRRVCQGHYEFVEDKGRWSWDDRSIEGYAIEKKIVITTDGKETIARLYNGKNVVESATAKCHPDDAFDFKKGAEIAMRRLMGEDKPAEQKKPETNVDKKWRVVDRDPVPGDYIRIVNPLFSFDKAGDILKIDGIDEKSDCPYVLEKNHKRRQGASDYKWYYNKSIHDYEVVEPVTESDKESENTKWRVVDRPAKVGDHIRLKTNGGYHFNEVGDILKVDIVKSKTLVSVYGRNHKRDTGCPGNDWNYFVGGECEVVEPVNDEPEKKYAFNVGDRVKDREHGKGTVICISGIGLYGVEFDRKKSIHHNCEGFTLVAGTVGTKGGCWWCNEWDLKLIEKKSEFVPHLFWKYAKHNYGTLGTATNYKDAIGRPLSVGDTVELYNRENKYIGEYPVTYDKENGFFIMSIAGSCDTKTGSTGEWKIIKKRSFEEVKDGEKVDDIEYIKTERKS